MSLGPGCCMHGNCAPDDLCHGNVCELCEEELGDFDADELGLDPEEPYDA